MKVKDIRKWLAKFSPDMEITLRVRNDYNGEYREMNISDLFPPNTSAPKEIKTLYWDFTIVPEHVVKTSFYVVNCERRRK